MRRLEHPPNHGTLPLASPGAGGDLFLSQLTGNSANTFALPGIQIKNTPDNLGLVRVDFRAGLLAVRLWDLHVTVGRATEHTYAAGFGVIQFPPA